MVTLQRRSGRRRADILLFGEEPLDVPYPIPNLLDTRYGIRKEGDNLMIGDKPMYVDTDDNITIKGTQFKGTEGLWALLTRKTVDMEHVGKADLGTYKKILLKTNAHLTGYRQGDTLNITREKKFREVIAPLFSHPKRRETLLAS
jgi:hypothetical protein